MQSKLIKHFLRKLKRNERQVDFFLHWLTAKTKDKGYFHHLVTLIAFTQIQNERSLAFCLNLQNQINFVNNLSKYS